MKVYINFFLHPLFYFTSIRQKFICLAFLGYDVFSAHLVTRTHGNPKRRNPSSSSSYFSSIDFTLNEFQATFKLQIWHTSRTYAFNFISDQNFVIFSCKHGFKLNVDL